MSEAKFTKGEWAANGAFVSHVDLGCDAIVSGAGCKSITYKEAEANANLIAAAPEMYKEIESDIANLNSLLMDMDPHTLEAAATERKIKRKTKLLAKARGES